MTKQKKKHSCIRNNRQKSADSSVWLIFDIFISVRMNLKAQLICSTSAFFVVSFPFFFVMCIFIDATDQYESCRFSSQKLFRYCTGSFFSISHCFTSFYAQIIFFSCFYSPVIVNQLYWNRCISTEQANLACKSHSGGLRNSLANLFACLTRSVIVNWNRNFKKIKRKKKKCTVSNFNCFLPVWVLGF